MIANKTAHTATPWKNHGPNDKGRCLITDASDSGICEVFVGANERGEANAAFIVRACNRDHLFDDLVMALETARSAIAGLMETDDDGHPSDQALHLARLAVGDANVALTKAEAP